VHSSGLPPIPHQYPILCVCDGDDDDDDNDNSFMMMHSYYFKQINVFTLKNNIAIGQVKYNIIRFIGLSYKKSLL